MRRYLYDKWKEYKEFCRKGRHMGAMDVESETEIHSCLNCGTEFHGHYCPNCGQSVGVKRLKIRHGIEDLFGIFTNFDSGFLHTCIELVYRPGYMMLDYLDGRRKEYIKPIQLLFLLATIYIFLHYILYGSDIEDMNVKNFVIEDKEINTVVDYIKKAFEYVFSNKALTYLTIVLLHVLPVRLCFYFTKVGKRLNISEIFFVMVYVGCQMLMIDIVRLPYYRFFCSVQPGFDFSAPVLLLIWDFYQLFEVKLRKCVLLCVLSNILMVVQVVILSLVVACCFLFVLAMIKDVSVVDEILNQI